MSLLPKTAPAQTFQMTVYNTPLPADFFFPKGRRVLSHEDYLIEALIMGGSHALRFDYGDRSVVELVTACDVVVPSAGQVASFSCPQERDFEHRFGPDLLADRVPARGQHRARGGAAPPAVAADDARALLNAIGGGKALRTGAMMYMTSVQTESLPDNLYRETLDELVDFGRQNGAVIHLWNEAQGPCLSMADLQRYNGQAHAQSYHMRPGGGVVLRTQTIFELSAPLG